MSTELLLTEAILALGREKSLTLSCAESCTGGAVGAALTELPGMSDVFLGSAVVYSNDAKKNLLGVAQAILDAHGAVSRECAESMAKGALELYGSSLSVAVTGIAGPGGGSAEKPVGTVWFAIAWRAEDNTECVSCVSFVKVFGVFGYDSRKSVREQAVLTALDAVRRKMDDMPRVS